MTKSSSTSPSSPSRAESSPPELSPSERVRRLVASGAATPEEGERLIAAMVEDAATKARAHAMGHTKESLLKTLLHPYDRYGGGVAATIGLVVSVVSIGVTLLGVRFDGFLDLHVRPLSSGTSGVHAIATSAAEQGIVWVLPALCYWAYARLFSRHVRVLDFLGMVGLARVAVLLSVIPVLALTPHIQDPTSLQSPSMLALVTVALLMLAVHITLLYQGFKNASGLAGVKLVGGFIGLLIVVEMITKLALLLLP